MVFKCLIFDVQSFEMIDNFKKNGNRSLNYYSIYFYRVVRNDYFKFWVNECYIFMNRVEIYLQVFVSLFFRI